MPEVGIERHVISLGVDIMEAGEWMAKDVAMVQLWEGYGDKNESRYSKKEFLKEILQGNVVIAMIKGDPIGYAVFRNGAVKESYVEFAFKGLGIEKLLEEFGSFSDQGLS